ncbi:MAG: bifunctional phosphopantothenoylcysteine decarboxylase/phosphopantothenate--cysteine ligase CoaBC [Candidatus Zixiibacteriota bacterium]|nr:MAG: bifunctional phosphopantothenoylcysteine decarboxylase/phosphopantothenate--cysteine ligase CoaBC [candidate division Zixibacteria bacterium]
MSLKNRKIIVGITGGIAAYKTPGLIRLLKKDGAEVQAVMTDAATKFITELTIETVSQRPVAREMFPKTRYVATHHIDLAEWADIFVVAPATANFVGKIASGICDDLLTTVICATKSPVMISPSMNSNMYLNPITQNNLKKLKSLGYIILDPNVGEMACETYGPGRMPEPHEIHQFVRQFFEKKKSLSKKKVLVTAGPCREPIDPVRFISNRSSGKMGFALALAAHNAGAEVTLISGPTSLAPEPGIELINVETTEQMHKAVQREFKKSHILIMAAAPADFKAGKIAGEKIKKAQRKSLSLSLSTTIDILEGLKKTKKKGQVVVGFALETDNALKNARAKLKSKDLDLIIVNSLKDGAPFDSDSNKVTLVGRTGRAESLPQMSKRELAEIIVTKISKLK